MMLQHIYADEVVLEDHLLYQPTSNGTYANHGFPLRLPRTRLHQRSRRARSAAAADRACV